MNFEFGNLDNLFTFVSEFYEGLNPNQKFFVGMVTTILTLTALSVCRRLFKRVPSELGQKILETLNKDGWQIHSKECRAIKNEKYQICVATPYIYSMNKNDKCVRVHGNKCDDLLSRKDKQLIHKKSLQIMQELMKRKNDEDRKIIITGLQQIT